MRSILAALALGLAVLATSYVPANAQVQCMSYEQVVLEQAGIASQIGAEAPVTLDNVDVVKRFLEGWNNTEPLDQGVVKDASVIVYFDASATAGLVGVAFVDMNGTICEDEERKFGVPADVFKTLLLAAQGKPA